MHASYRGTKRFFVGFLKSPSNTCRHSRRAAVCSSPSPRPSLTRLQVFPKLNRTNAHESAADYVNFVTAMYAVPAPAALLQVTRVCRGCRQHDLAQLGQIITLDQFSQKMWEIITANEFYDHHHWIPGPLGRRDPVFQTLMFALWSMVSAHVFEPTFQLSASLVPHASRRRFNYSAAILPLPSSFSFI
jgi:hypothetical protein